jgi:catechol 2,3-dioxygenase-like lactoylglutathione lyase family enzyme
VDRSRLFYETYFAFDPATARFAPDGTLLLSNADGFDLALHPVDAVGEEPAFLHFGFGVASPDHVRELLTRLRADNVDIIEYDDEPSYVAFKAADPDGHRIEVYWETNPGTTTIIS